MEFDITKMSSKGQVVIPLQMRKGIKEGEKLLIIKSGEKLILKKIKELDKDLKEDLEFARRTEEAWKRYERGEFIGPMSVEQFKKRMKSW
ncbi:MAG: AbrB/MazE/SpoVT family DNA-binding domain-containing protein [Candidatus Woesearchaeota archaeon]|nr:MAG: AbrB/MazE/SpoVT family DNA-binding domain-containing protein [Candidatus Woesearchaeota archaeon]